MAIRHPSGTMWPRFALLAVVSCGWRATDATQVRPLNLEEMTARAERIFSGRCVEISHIEDPDLGDAVIVATFEVHRVVKGGADARVQVRMADGETACRPGEDVVLFLYGKDAAGWSSPVGLGQGKFDIVADKLERWIAVNPFGNRGLFRGLTERAAGKLEASTREAEIRAADLLDIAEALAVGP
jgi:hypothetical protein